jgi:hypothetical protein
MQKAWPVASPCMCQLLEQKMTMTSCFVRMFALRFQFALSPTDGLQRPRLHAAVCRTPNFQIHVLLFATRSSRHLDATASPQKPARSPYALALAFHLQSSWSDRYKARTRTAATGRLSPC